MCNDSCMKHPILKYRTDANVTPKQLCDRLGVENTTLWRWETGRVKIPVERLDKIERVTGIPRQKLRPDIFGKGL